MSCPPPSTPASHFPGLQQPWNIRRLTSSSLFLLFLFLFLSPSPSGECINSREYHNWCYVWFWKVTEQARLIAGGGNDVCFLASLAWSHWSREEGNYNLAKKEISIEAYIPDIGTFIVFSSFPIRGSPASLSFFSLLPFPHVPYSMRTRWWWWVDEGDWKKEEDRASCWQVEGVGWVLRWVVIIIIGHPLLRFG